MSSPEVFLRSAVAGPWQTNCWLLACGDDAVAVDPGMGGAAAVESLLAAAGAPRLRAVLATHGHLDHVADVAEVCARHDVALWIAAQDRHLLTDPAAGLFPGAEAMLGQFVGPDHRFVEPAIVHEFDEATPVTIGALTFRPRLAPGHTPGSTVLEVAVGEEPPALLLSGDVLFAGAVGRVDLRGGDARAMTATLRDVVRGLDPGLRVLPGHGPESTMERELATNPFLLDPDLVGAL